MRRMLRAGGLEPSLNGRSYERAQPSGVLRARAFHLGGLAGLSALSDARVARAFDESPNAT